MQASLTSSAAMQHCAELSTEKRRDGCNVISAGKKALIRDVRVNERMLRKKQSLDHVDPVNRQKLDFVQDENQFNLHHLGELTTMIYNG